MPPFSQHHSSTIVKCLLIGDSGTGKSSALADLANAGYRLFIWDYDNGLSSLNNFLTPEGRGRVFYETLTDKLGGPKAIPIGPPDAIQRGAALFEKWPDNLGSPRTWGERDVAVTDSITFQGKAALRYVVSLNNRTGLPLRVNDWGDAMAVQEGWFQAFFDASIKCNVIMTAHLKYQEPPEGGGLQVAYASALGSNLPPVVPRYFDHVLGTEAVGAGISTKYRLHTRRFGSMSLKTPAPSVVPAFLEAPPGKPLPLAEYFRLVKSIATQPVAPATTPSQPGGLAVPTQPK